MVDKIYTIPITEAFNKDCDCPFCAMYEDIENDTVRRTLGPAMMEPEFRKITNEKGFCNKHIAMLNAESKVLPLALVLESHIKEYEDLFNFNFHKKSILKKDNQKENYIKEFGEKVKGCAVCDAVNSTFERYIDTFIYMIKENPDFFDTVLKSKGFCLPHYYEILKHMDKTLNDKSFKILAEKLNDLEYKKFEKYKNDITGFIESFDYKMAGKPLEVPRDTVLKASCFLSSKFEEKEKKLDDI